VETPKKVLSRAHTDEPAPCKIRRLQPFIGRASAADTYIAAAAAYIRAAYSLVDNVKTNSRIGISCRGTYAS
jgi:hypothetical protein